MTPESSSVQGLPADPDAEKHVLYTALTNDVATHEALEALRAADFSNESHRRVFTAIAASYAKRETGLIAVADELRRKNQLDLVGGLGFLAYLGDGFDELREVAPSIRIVREKSLLRRHILEAQALINGAISNQDLCETEVRAQKLAELANSRQCESSKVGRIEDVKPIAEYQTSEIEFLVPDLIAVGTVILLTGDSGSGKSTLATCWCDEVQHSRRVLYLDRENPLSVVRERFERLGVTQTQNLTYWGGWLADEAPAPSSPVLTDWVQQCDPKPMIVLDSAISFHDGDENDSAEVRRFMHASRRLADIGATVIILHHSGKSETSRDYRGSSDFKAAVDCGFNLTNLGGDSSRLTTLRLRAFKSRFTVESDLILHYDHGRFERDDRPSLRTMKDALRDLLIANPSIRAADFEAKAVEKGLGRNLARNFLGDGVLSGTIRQDKGLKNARYHTWEGGAEA